MINVVALRGVLARPAEERVLPSGDRLANIDVTIRPASGPAESVPVSWFDPPARVAEMGVGEEVLVVGRVRRRFFRQAGATRSRTDVVADAVVPVRLQKRARAALEAAIEGIEEAL